MTIQRRLYIAAAIAAATVALSACGTAADTPTPYTPTQAERLLEGQINAEAKASDNVSEPTTTQCVSTTVSLDFWTCTTTVISATLTCKVITAVTTQNSKWVWTSPDVRLASVCS